MTTAAWPLSSVSRARPGLALHLAALVSADVLAILAAGAVTVLTRYSLGARFEPAFYWRMSAVTLIFPLAYLAVGLYPGIALHPAAELQGIFRATTLTVLLLATLSFFQRNPEAYSRSILLCAWLLIIVFVWLARALIRQRLGRTAWWGERAVIIGAGRIGRRVADTLGRNPGSGLRVVAILDDDAAKLARARGSAPVTASLMDAPRLAHQFGARYAIIAMPECRGQRLTAIIERYASGFHHVVIIPDLSGLSSLGVDARDLGGVLGVRVSHRLLYRTPQAVKRVVDLLAAGIGGLSLLPLFGVISILVRLTSPGAVFYGHERVGRGGCRFTAWKFRTMVSNGDEVLRRHLQGDPASRVEWMRGRKLKQDPRVTAVGRFLRRTSLDELPQIWNVIRGEMSLVGPRPIVESEIRRYGLRYSLYTKVRPGLTGLWQVSGRNNTTYVERVHFDEYYVRNWSVWLDLYILGKTIKVVLAGDGAY